MAAEQGLQSCSFDRAACSFTRAVGAQISGDSVRRITEGWGRQVEQGRATEVEQVFALGDGGGTDSAAVIEKVCPLGERGNLSTDGHLIPIRGEGWKEVKLSVISAVEVRPVDEASPSDGQREASRVHLYAHSCQAGLWDADTLGQYQYVEGLRRGLEDCQHLSSVNDAAAWIERITAENYPQAVRIVDWSHAVGHLWTVAQVVFGVGDARSQDWVDVQKELLWQGRAVQVSQAIGALPSSAQEVTAAQGYFEGHQDEMHYDRYRAAGYPIGSGTVESGGKNYVQYRLKRPGRGWGRDNAQSMLAVLSEMHSDRFDYAWEHFAQPTNLR